MYIFSGDHPLLALLRPSNIDNTTGLLKHLRRIVERLRQVWPGVKILVRGDSGFCREHLMSRCEANNVAFLFGLAKNPRLLKLLQPALQQAAQQFAESKPACRVFQELTYRTLDSWSQERRVVGKAEHLDKGPNPRFVVTSLAAETVAAQPLYEQEYCARGDMENRIKEQQLMLFANRVSCATMRANQLRLCLATVAYVLMRALRQYGLGQTELATAQCDTMRVKLLKIGALVWVSVRRVCLSLSEAYPWRSVFVQAWQQLSSLSGPPGPCAEGGCEPAVAGTG